MEVSNMNKTRLKKINKSLDEIRAIISEIDKIGENDIKTKLSEIVTQLKMLQDEEKDAFCEKMCPSMEMMGWHFDFMHIYEFGLSKIEHCISDDLSGAELKENLTQAIKNIENACDPNH